MTHRKRLRFASLLFTALWIGGIAWMNPPQQALDVASLIFRGIAVGFLWHWLYGRWYRWHFAGGRFPRGQT